MTKKDPRPQVNTKSMEDEKYGSREWAFANSYIKHNRNATKAALEVCGIGKRGSKNPERSAEAVGSRLLSSAIVQTYIAEIVRTHFNPLEAVKRVQEIARDTKHPGVSLDACSLILKITGIYQEKGLQASVVPQVNLVMPVPPQNTKK